MLNAFKALAHRAVTSCKRAPRPEDQDVDADVRDG